MKNFGAKRWFLIGFAATSLILLVAGLTLRPTAGRAQEGGEEEPNNLIWASGDTTGSSQQTDDPDGRQQIPFTDESTLLPNNVRLDAEVAESNGRTDDPTGRAMIPFSDEPAAPGSNLEASVRTDGQFNAAANLANETREAELRANVLNQYTSPLVISAADFGADGANPDSFFFPFGGGYMQGDSQNYGCMQAPVYLPDGVTITDLFVSVYDDEASYDLFIDLRRADNFNGGTNTLASASTTGQFTGLQVINDASITNPLVTYPDYSYYVTTCLQSSSIRIYSARVYYTGP